MTEEREIPEYDPEARPDPIATGIAIGRASPAIDSEVIAFLRDQRLHLHEQFRHLREQLRLKLWEQRMGVMLRVATMIVGTAVAAGFGLLIWDAAHSNGLIIEPFSVPPDMAQRGLTGQVVAAQLLDKLAVLSASESSRATQSYANNWGDNIKVEIPETGVSVQELYRFLRQWLGHDIDITGEVYRTAAGIAVTARAGDKGATFTGAETGLDTLVQQAAEHVFESTQPYRYANYLDRNYAPAGLEDRIARATAIYRKLIAGNDPLERAWAWNGLGTIAYNFYGNQRESAADYLKGIASTPDFTIGYFALASRYDALDDKEKELAAFQTASNLLHRPSVPDLNQSYLVNARYFADADLAGLTGDYGAGIPLFKAGAELPDTFSVLARGVFWASAATFMAQRHETTAANSYLRSVGVARLTNLNARDQYYALLEDWRSIAADEAVQKAAVAQARGTFRSGALSLNAYNETLAFFALARAKLGDLDGAETMIAPTAGDCDGCLRIRAQIAEMRGQHGRADWWFARAVKNAPSIPFAYTDWGQALLARGDGEGAIAQFTIANQKGPHFADPLEMWGEALMAQKHPDLALPKFAEADKYAPNWGRLHLKWGEALAAAGKADEARTQFARAVTLDLSPTDKAELLRETPHG